jgi:RNA recognition motif-containing protein
MAIKLFVGGLSFTTTDEGLRETFAVYGAVESAQVVKSPDGRSRGFGFVEMTNTDEAEQAVTSLNRSTLDGRTITVERSTPRRPGRRVVGAQARSR